jgi:hypothetical protein
MAYLQNTSIVKQSIFFLFLLLTAVTNAATIKGRVIDGDTHETIPGAVVSILGTSAIVVADAGGSYSFSDLRQDTYTISAKCMGYVTSIPQQIIITTPDAIITFDVYLKPSVKQINEVVINGARNKESDETARHDEKVAPNVINIISAKTIESLPDLNVANVMQRVSGVSMVKNNTGNNTEVIIRGMPPRYNSTLVNGTTAPSTSGSTRSVPLDIIPSNLVGRIEVTKALTPDKEASGLGGIVNVEMKDAPETPVFSIDLATGYNQYFFNHKLSTFNTSVVAMKDPAARNGNDYLAELSDFSRENMVITKKQTYPDLNGSLSFGRRFFNKKLGVIISGTADNNCQGSLSNFYGTQTNISNSLDITSWNNTAYYTQLLRTGSNVKLDYQINSKNRISLYNSFLRLKEIRVRNEVDTTAEINKGRIGSQDITNIDISTLNSTNLQGHHELLNNLDIDWSLVYSIASSQSPDLVTVRYIQIIHPSVQPVYLNYTSCVSRVWQHNTDEDKTAYLNIIYRPLIFNHLFEFKVGGMGRMKFRNNYANEYTFDAPIDNPPNPEIQNVVVTQNRNAQQRNGNPVNNPGNYKATEDIQAGYLQVKTSFGKLQVLTGVRVEFTYQTNYHSETQNVAVPFTRNRFSYYDILPSLHLNYHFTDRQNLRVSVYQGISRPNYTELVDFYAQGVNGGSQGNSHLNHSVGTCFDARYEIYPNKEEVFTGGIFYKSLQKPIEDVLSGNNVSKPTNINNCVNYGFELVCLKYFGNFGISANYTYTKSVIKVPKVFYLQDSTLTHVTETRPLIGQSPHIINVAFIYRNIEKELKCELVYTMQGKNVKNVSDSYGLDTYQKAFHDLGATLEKKVYKKLLVYAKVSNLLNSKVEYYTKSGIKVRDISTSSSYLIGLKYNL